jgi:hypothetical protein
VICVVVMAAICAVFNTETCDVVSATIWLVFRLAI